MLNGKVNTINRSLLPKYRSRHIGNTIVLVTGCLATLLGMFLSITYGAANIDMDTVWKAVFFFNPDLMEHQIIHTLRLPRVLGGVMVGASLAVSGALMQAVTRNPMADPGLLGLNAGAAFVLTMCMAFSPGLPFVYLILYAFIGAAFGAGLVLGVSSLARGGLSPLKLVLAGATVSALLMALSEGIALYFNISQDIGYWYAGGMAGTKWIQLKIMLPWVAGAILGSLFLAKSISILNLGEDVASGLGAHIQLVKLTVIVIVVILAGSAVAIVGAIGFVGLIIPHLARYVVGVDYRWVIPCSCVFGGMLVVYADLSARMIHPPYETPIAALIALIGVPFFLYLTRRGRG
jgi:iron complex transport system permease protein